MAEQSGFQTSYLPQRNVTSVKGSGIGQVTMPTVSDYLGFEPGRLNEIREAAGLPAQPEKQMKLFNPLQPVDVSTGGGFSPVGGYGRPFLEGIASRQAQTSANLQALDARDSDDLGSAPTAPKTIADELSDLSKGLGADATDDARAARKLAEESDTTITNSIIATENDGTTTDTTIDARANATKDALTEDTNTGGAVDPFEDILKKAMDGVATARGEEPKMKLEDYREEFAKATGVDISGKPDRSQALMALGLSLMQNKAGRDFNVSNALAAVGEAGEKAMPEFAKAKEVARNAKIAAGKYGLQQVAADKAAKAAKVAAAQKVVDEMLKQERSDISAAALEAQKHEYDLALKEMETDATVEAAGLKAQGNREKLRFDFAGEKALNPVKGNSDITYHVATSKYDGRTVYTKPEVDVDKLASGYADAIDGAASIDKTIDYLRTIKAGEGVTLTQAKTAADNFLKGLGIDINVNYATGETLSPITKIENIKNRIIQQYKRFLTQETGNGISNVDVEKLEKTLGKIDWFTNPEAAIDALTETRKIFDSSRKNIEKTLVGFGDKGKYLNPEAYEPTQNKIQEAIFGSIGVGRDNIETFVDDNNVTVFKIS